MRRDDIGYLGEVMNYPGVLAGDPELMRKITDRMLLDTRTMTSVTTERRM